VVAALPTNVTKCTITWALGGVLPVDVDALAVGSIVPSYSITYKNTRVQGGVSTADVSVSGAGTSLVMEVVTSGDEKYRSCELGGLSVIRAGVSAVVKN